MKRWEWFLTVVLAAQTASQTTSIFSRWARECESSKRAIEAFKVDRFSSDSLLHLGRVEMWSGFVFLFDLGGKLTGVT